MAPAPAAAPATTQAVDRAATAAAGEDAAPRRHAGGAAAGEGTGSEVRDGSLPGTVRSTTGKRRERKETDTGYTGKEVALATEPIWVRFFLTEHNVVLT